MQIKYFFRNSMKGHVDQSDPQRPFCNMFVTVGVTAGHGWEDLRGPVFDGTLDKLSIQLMSPLFPQPSPWEGAFFVTELGLYNHTWVVMAPGKEARKAASIVRNRLLFSS